MADERRPDTDIDDEAWQRQLTGLTDISVFHRAVRALDQLDQLDWDAELVGNARALLYKALEKWQKSEEDDDYSPPSDE